MLLFPFASVLEAANGTVFNALTEHIIGVSFITYSRIDGCNQTGNLVASVAVCPGGSGIDERIIDVLLDDIADCIVAVDDFHDIGGVLGMDGCSRYILHWEIRESMTEADVEIVLQRAREMYPDVTPRIISDN